MSAGTLHSLQCLQTRSMCSIDTECNFMSTLHICIVYAISESASTAACSLTVHATCALQCLQLAACCYLQLAAHVHLRAQCKMIAACMHTLVSLTLTSNWYNLLAQMLNQMQASPVWLRRHAEAHNNNNNNNTITHLTAASVTFWSALLRSSAVYAVFSPLSAAAAVSCSAAAACAFARCCSCLSFAQCSLQSHNAFKFCE
eukprot:2270-Heterococcus_DN1.PRE.4